MSTMQWERRRSFRVAVQGKALLDRGGALDGVYDIDDVSISGCSLRRRSNALDASRAEHVMLALHVDGGAELELPARVVRGQQSDGIVHLALKFTHANAAHEDLIQDLVIDSLEHHGARKPRRARSRRAPTASNETHGDVLVVHSHPDRERALLGRVRELGHRLRFARTAREAVSVLERATERIRVALVADVVGTSRARDIMKLILRQFPHVQCFPMGRYAAEHLLAGAAGKSAARGTAREESAWSLSRLHKAGSPGRRSVTA